MNSFECSQYYLNSLIDDSCVLYKENVYNIIDTKDSEVNEFLLKVIYDYKYLKEITIETSDDLDFTDKLSASFKMKEYGCIGEALIKCPMRYIRIKKFKDKSSKSKITICYLEIKEYK